MPFLVVGFVVWLYSLKHLKNAFLWYLVFKIFLVTNINIVSMPGVPMLSLDTALALWFFFRVYKSRRNYDVPRLPYIKPMLAVTVVYFISTLFAVAGFNAALSTYIKDLCSIVFMPWMMWKVVSTKDDFDFLFKWISISMMMTCVYAVFELSLQANPLVAYEVSLVSDASRAIDFNYGIDSYRGYRVQSVFEHAIGAGINWAMFAIFVLTVFVKKYMSLLHFNFFHVIVAAFCVVCVFFTNCRGPLLFFMIGGVSLLSLRSKRSYILISFALLGALTLFSVLGDNYINNLLSIFDSSYQDRVGGSSAEQRYGQLDAVFNLMKQSPLFGFGYKFFNVLNNSDTRALLGLESMWFRILVQFGIMGAVANIYLAYYSIVRVPRKYKQGFIFWFSLAYWITASLTSVPGMLMYLYYLIIFFFIKQSTDFGRLS